MFGFETMGASTLFNHFEPFVFSLGFSPAVGNSPPFLTNLPFHDFPKYFNHE
jgi:hypothetical protein